jgi:transaldolase
METLNKLKIKIFADGADDKEIFKLNEEDHIKGFTTNPSLMRKANIKNYETFAKDLLSKIKIKPVSFEVFSDELKTMEKQAEKIATWGRNVNVKIPITNTKGVSTCEIIQKLSSKGIICNITAIFTLEQLKGVVEILHKDTPAILSVFSGRIADAGIDPEKIIFDSVNFAKNKPHSEVLWASTREVFNIFQAEKNGCQIITVPHNMLSKFNIIGKNLNEYSIETVKDFYNDAKAAGYEL